MSARCTAGPIVR